MTGNGYFPASSFLLILTAAGMWLAGCTSTNQSPSTKQPSSSSRKATTTVAIAGHFSPKYTTDDKRTAVIGVSTATNGGWSFKNPHMNHCWIATDFDFKGYDTLHIAPTLSNVKYRNDEERPHQLAQENLVQELNRSLVARGLFTNVVTRESDIKPGARTLRMENTITEYSKGKASSRFWAGEMGAGQPVLRVFSKMTDGDKLVFTCEARRSGVSAKARTLGSSMKDEDIQLEDIRSIVLDLSDFMAAIAGKYSAKN